MQGQSREIDEASEAPLEAGRCRSRGCRQDFGNPGCPALLSALEPTHRLAGAEQEVQVFRNLVELAGAALELAVQRRAADRVLAVAAAQTAAVEAA